MRRKEEEKKLTFSAVRRRSSVTPIASNSLQLFVVVVVVVNGEELYLHHHFVPRVVFFSSSSRAEGIIWHHGDKKKRKIQKFQWPIANKTRKSRRNVDKKKKMKKIVVHDRPIWDNKRANQLAIQQVLPEKGMRIFWKTKFFLGKRIFFHPRHLSAFIFFFKLKRNSTTSATTTKQHLVNCQFLFVSFNFSWKKCNV